MKEQERKQQINREAKYSLLAVAIIVVFWIVSGFGVSYFHVTVFHTPLWAITGCLGTWLVSVLLVVWLIKKIYKNFSLDDEEEKDEN
ncbi:MAG: YhdT family protein [Lachnospiraceae bacterium]|nr:YhdT family protein [Lachnospiraceae bacterium]